MAAVLTRMVMIMFAPGVHRLNRDRRENGSGLFRVFTGKSSFCISLLAAIAMSCALFMWVYVICIAFPNFYKIKALPGLLWFLFVVVFTGILVFVTVFGYCATVYGWRTRNTPLMVLGKFRMFYMKTEGRKISRVKTAYPDIRKIDVDYEIRPKITLTFLQFHKVNGEKDRVLADSLDVRVMDLLCEINRRAPWLKQPYSTVPLLVSQSSGIHADGK